jgi:hypothetical protein
MTSGSVITETIFIADPQVGHRSDRPALGLSKQAAFRLAMDGLP